MRKSTTFFGIFALAALIGVTMVACSDGDDRDDDSIIVPGAVVPINRFEAQKTSEVGNNKIKYSYSYGGYDFYYIHLGRLRNVPLFSHVAEHHNGMNSIYEIKNIETIKNTTVETITSSSKTIENTVREHTYSTENRQRISAAINVGFPISLVSVGVKSTAEASWSQHSSTREFQETTVTTSLTSTITYGTEHTNTTMKLRKWNFTEAHPVGYYRYTLFSISDVYLYVIRDSTGAIHHDFKEHIVPGTDASFWSLDYSETMPFEKNDDTGFEFDISILDNLPKPELVLTSLPAKKTIVEFAVAGDTSYTFNGLLPATAEVYVLGAGGGGQGGHGNIETAFLGTNTIFGTGGSGGGGSAAYMSFIINDSTTFDITVGRGGSGGGSTWRNWGQHWASGGVGGTGGNTTVSVGSRTIIAEGGIGGGGPETALNGGRGGRGGSQPADIDVWAADSGKNGVNGVYEGDRMGRNPGGDAALVRIGSVNPFGGGLGAMGDNEAQAGAGGRGGYGTGSSGPGTRGGDGLVVIVITYQD